MGDTGGVFYSFTVPQDYRIVGFYGSQDYAIFQIGFYLAKSTFPAKLNSFNTTTNFNYVSNGDLKKNNCTIQSLSSMYSCTIGFDNSLFC